MSGDLTGLCLYIARYLSVNTIRLITHISLVIIVYNLLCVIMQGCQILWLDVHVTTCATIYHIINKRPFNFTCRWPNHSLLNWTSTIPSRMRNVFYFVNSSMESNPTKLMTHRWLKSLTKISEMSMDGMSQSPSKNSHLINAMICSFWQVREHSC